GRAICLDRSGPVAGGLLSADHREQLTQIATLQSSLQRVARLTVSRWVAFHTQSEASSGAKPSLSTESGGLYEVALIGGASGRLRVAISHTSSPPARPTRSE